MPHRDEDTSGGPSSQGPQAPPPGYGPAWTLGSREHVCETLQRAGAALRASRAGPVESQTLLARAAARREAAERAAQESLAQRAQLRASVTAYVLHLRADGVPSERMVVDVKAAVREATPPALDAYEARDLMEEVVRWSVEAFYHVG